MRPTPAREDLAYAAFWCEENAWQLAGVAVIQPLDVLIVTNRARATAIWAQRAAHTPGAPVLWDYHVLVVGGGEGGPWIWDLDTTLPFPCPPTDYVEASFRPSARLPDAMRPWFRRVPAEVYRRELRSDRGHMRTADGGWQAPPPPWPPIDGPGGRLRLSAALDLDDADAPGDWLDLAGLRRHYAI
jgi:hypothetical protein